MVVRSVESMTPEPKLMTISSSRNIRRRWLPNRPPRVGWALVLATVLAISTAFIYAARGVMYASAVRWANGLEMDSEIGRASCRERGGLEGGEREIVHTE